MTEVEDANRRFGEQGERVLAFARIDLDPINTPFNKSYKFDARNWTAWENIKDEKDRPSGWFPMTDFTLIGLVSLKDAPRPSVD